MRTGAGCHLKHIYRIAATRMAYYTVKLLPSISAALWSGLMAKVIVDRLQYRYGSNKVYIVHAP